MSFFWGLVNEYLISKSYSLVPDLLQLAKKKIVTNTERLFIKKGLKIARLPNTNETVTLTTGKQETNEL